MGRFLAAARNEFHSTMTSLFRFLRKYFASFTTYQQHYYCYYYRLILLLLSLLGLNNKLFNNIVTQK
jgi:hypothetical protein